MSVHGAHNIIPKRTNKMIVLYFIVQPICPQNLERLHHVHYTYTRMNDNNVSDNEIDTVLQT